jgi:hypothetical protein
MDTFVSPCEYLPRIIFPCVRQNSDHLYLYYDFCLYGARLTASGVPHNWFDILAINHLDIMAHKLQKSKAISRFLR